MPSKRAPPKGGMATPGYGFETMEDRRRRLRPDLYPAASTAEPPLRTVLPEVRSPDSPPRELERLSPCPLLPMAMGPRPSQLHRWEGRPAPSPSAGVSRTLPGHCGIATLACPYHVTLEHAEKVNVVFTSNASRCCASSRPRTPRGTGCSADTHCPGHRILTAEVSAHAQEVVALTAA